jgi:enamine deaminase RidA (YjgF/YER057c/UK114 family)
VSAEGRLAELGIELPDPAPAAGNYVPAKRSGRLVFMSGAGPVELDRSGLVIGKVGADLTVEEGAEAARLTGINLLAALRQEIGSLDDVEQVVKLLGMVNAAPGFTELPTVVNGCSDLLVEVFGEAGRHARSAVGMAELPFGMAVEIEAIFEVA